MYSLFDVRVKMVHGGCLCFVYFFSFPFLSLFFVLFFCFLLLLFFSSSFFSLSLFYVCIGFFLSYEKKSFNSLFLPPLRI